MNRLMGLAVVAVCSVASVNAQDVHEDMLMHDLVKGRVKRYLKAASLDYNFNNSEFNTMWTYFDRDGRIQRDGTYQVYLYDGNGRYVRGQFDGAGMERNERGSISRDYSGDNPFIEAAYDYKYTYNAYGKVEKMEYSSYYATGTVTYVYGADNEMVSSHTEYNGEGAVNGVVDETYVITDRDDEGNWIERKMHHKEVETNEDGTKEVSEYDETEYRRIEYYRDGEQCVNAERFIIPVTVTGTNVRLRLGPSTKHQILTKGGKTVYPRKGEKLKYLGETQDFYRVEYQKAEVYISKQFAERDCSEFLMW